MGFGKSPCYSRLNVGALLFPAFLAVRTMVWQVLVVGCKDCKDLRGRGNWRIHRDVSWSCWCFMMFLYLLLESRCHKKYIILPCQQYIYIIYIYIYNIMYIIPVLDHQLHRGAQSPQRTARLQCSAVCTRPRSHWRVTFVMATIWAWYPWWRNLK